ncbi:MAG: hypothetical protein WCA81_04020 [Rhizomicrobium sp.]|jgi:cation transport ATPase
MSLTSKEAAETLSDVERASRRSAQAFGYRKASPHLILWGLVWVAGYSATDLYPQFANYIWAGLVFVGVVGSYLIGKATASRDAASAAKSRAIGLRMFGLVGIVWIFMAATYTMFQPTHGIQFAAFPSVLIGALYCGAGLWAGLRFIVVGALVIALTLVGYYLLSAHFLLWMAFVGGGALILAGFWFRQV